MEKKPFFISTVAWHGLHKDKLIANLNHFSKTLKGAIDLKNYGRDLEEIAVIFIALPYETALHPERIEYSPKKKEVFAEKKVPYDLVQNEDTAENMAVFANTFLSIVQDFSKLKIRDFDLQRFRHDVEQLFESQGWLVQQAA